MTDSHKAPRQGFFGRFQRAWLRLKIDFINRVLDGVFFKRDWEHFYLAFGGHIFFQTLHAAVQFDLFTKLSNEPGLSKAEIASRLGIQEQPARIMLLGLVSSGVLRKVGSRYYNTRVSEQMLSKNSPKNVISYVYLEHHAVYNTMRHLYESIQQFKNVGLTEFKGNEPTLYQRLAHVPEVGKLFQDAMAELSIQTNDLMSTFLDLDGTTHIVDVGGGNGTNIMALARRHPHLKASVFDLPAVVEMAKKKLAASGIGDRLGTIAGNCFTDSFPPGADAFMFCHFFTMWSEKKDRLLLKKAYEALPKGGKVVLFNMMQNKNEAGPLSAAVGSAYFLALASGEGMLYTWDEYMTWMREAGFAHVKRHELPFDHGLIIGVKP